MYETIPDKPERPENTTRKRRIWRTVVAAVAGVAAVATFGKVNWNFQNMSELWTAPPMVGGASPPGPKHPREQKPPIMLTSEHERRTGIRYGSGLYYYEYLAEVHTATRIEIQEPDDDCTYTWSVQGQDETVTGPVFETTFKSVGKHRVSMTTSCPTGDADATYDVNAKYVRKEIRQLSSKERSTFFDALEIVYKETSSAGRSKYGSKFYSISELVKLHLQGAADRDCDHWHDDAGIMTHHMAFTLMLEQSLQSVDSSIAMPYWDYTQEAALPDWTTSEIFDSTWFGAASPDTSNHAITEGRWAYLSVEKIHDDTKSWSKIRNPYGLLRSPWNTNPTPYVLRHRYVLGAKDGKWSIPSCSLFDSTYDQTTLSGLLQALNGYLHGPVHIMLGGHWFWDSKYNVSFINSEYETLTSSFLLSSKYMWRQGYVRCPEYCADDTPLSTCTCGCPSDIVGDAAPYTILSEAGIFNLTSEFENTTFLGSMGLDYDSLLDLLCHVGHPGEMFTSAAPYDPIFWSVHGLADRFLTYKRLKSLEGETKFEDTWGYQHDTTASDTHHRCDWSGVTPDSMKMPTCFKDTCPGHREHDLLPMGDFLDENETYTNKEFYIFTSPHNDLLPYVYDSFDYWPACSAENLTWFDDDDFVDDDDSSSGKSSSGGGKHSGKHSSSSGGGRQHSRSNRGGHSGFW